MVTCVAETRGTKAIQRLAPLGKYSPLPLVGQNEGGTLNKSKVGQYLCFFVGLITIPLNCKARESERFRTWS